MELKEYWEGIDAFTTHLDMLDKNNIGRGNYHALFNLGMCFQRLNDNNKAIFYFRQSLMYLNNTQKEIYTNLENLGARKKVPKILNKFEINLTGIEGESEREYRHNYSFRNLALNYRRINEYEKSNNLNKRILREYEKKYPTLVSDKPDQNIDKRIVKLYFDIKNNLANSYLESGYNYEALDEIGFVDENNLNEFYSFFNAGVLKHQYFIE